MAEMHIAASPVGILVRAVDPASPRPGPGRTGAHQPCDPTPSRRRRERRRHPVAAEPGAGSGWQKPARHRGLGASERVGEPHRAVAERASAPLGGVPGRHRRSTAGRPIGGAAAAVGGALFARCRRQQPEPARQQRDGLASARGLRSERWRLQPPGTDGPARCGIAAALRGCDGRGADCRPWLRQGQRVAPLSCSVGPGCARLYRAGRLESTGSARCAGRSVPSDRPSGDVARPMRARRNGRCRRWLALPASPACCRSG